MKKLFYLLIFYVISFLPAKGQNDNPHSQSISVAPVKLTSADCQSDLRFLQQTVHNDYSFLFKNIRASEFDEAVDNLYKALPTMKEHEVLAGFARIVASFKYGHTDIGWRESPVKYHVAPLNFYWFSDGIHVEGADKKYPEIIGAKLLKVEGVSALNALTALKLLVPAENEQYLKAYGLDFLTIPEALHAQKISKELKMSVNYTFEKDGKTFEKTIDAVDAFRFPRQYGFVKHGNEWMSVRNQASIPYYLKNLDKIYYFEYLPANKTVYIGQSQIQDDYKSNGDPTLEACLNFSDKDLAIDPMTHLKELFVAGKLDQVETEAKKMITDPRYRYINFEQKINKGGYDLINSKQIESSIFVFQLNTKLFPKSANTWDSLAEAFWKANKTDKAIEYYNKAIELDLDGDTGKNARSMLNQIKGQKGF